MAGGAQQLRSFDCGDFLALRVRSWGPESANGSKNLPLPCRDVKQFSIGWLHHAQQVLLSQLSTTHSPRKEKKKQDGV